MGHPSSLWQKLRLASFARWLVLVLVLVGPVGWTGSFASVGHGAATDTAPTALKNDVATVSAPTKLARLVEPRSGNDPDDVIPPQEQGLLSVAAAGEVPDFGDRLDRLVNQFPPAQPRAPPLS